MAALRLAVFDLRRGALAAATAIGLAACQTQSTNWGDDGDLDKAAASEVNLDSLSVVIRQNPTDPNGYITRGAAYGRAGKLKEAMADFDKPIALTPQSYQAYYNRAVVEHRLDRDQQALADHNQAIAINANYAVAYVGRGELYRQSGKLDLALADFSKAISIDRNDP